MLLQLLRFSSNPSAGLTLALALLIILGFSLPVHEFSHAVVAYALGDTTAQRQGRLTLNPAKHLDPFGTILMLLAGFGWAKPTPVNPYKLRTGPNSGMALVSAAGPISNFLMAFLFALPITVGHLHLGLVRFNGSFYHWTTANYVALLCLYLVILNVLLGVFNLIPLAPLDGSRVAVALLPGEMGDFFRRIEPYGIPILMVLFSLSWLSPQLNVISRVINPIQDRIVRLILG